MLRQRVFMRRQTLLHLLSPGTSVTRKRLPGVSVDSPCLQVTLADVLEAQLARVSLSASSQLPVLHGEGPWGYGRPPCGRRGPASYSMVFMEVIPVLSSTVLLGTLSFQEMPTMRPRQRMWKELSLVSFFEFKVHDSLP